MSLPVFVRAKRVARRRYLYLVEGKREDGRVKQRTLCYLGPLSELAAGVPEGTRKKVDLRFFINWKKVNDEIGRIPLTFEELSEARRRQFTLSAVVRSRRGRPTQGGLPRAEGELSALSKLAASRFEELFEEIGPLTFRMR
jgi:hypothetical protein